MFDAFALLTNAAALARSVLRGVVAARGASGKETSQLCSLLLSKKPNGASQFYRHRVKAESPG